jgi:hypothetical protein
VKNSTLPNNSPDRFGYSSIHLILKIKEEWANNPTFINHKDKKFEIQLRTLSEHIWAETSHSLFYKRTENIPNVLNRDLSRVAALLEVVDEKLQSLKDKVEEHLKYIQDATYEEILNQDLNAETFKRVMKHNSNGLYNLNENENKALSSKIEKDYNILNVNILDSLISNKIDLNDIDNQKYIDSVFEILNLYKAKIDEETRK